jgi:uncharacterized protein YrrD
MELRMGANIVCSDGKHGGKLHYILLSPHDNSLEALVVEHGLVGQRDLVVDKEDIAEINPDGNVEQIDIKFTQSGLVNQPEYINPDYIVPTSTGEKFSSSYLDAVDGALITPLSLGSSPAAIYPMSIESSSPLPAQDSLKLTRNMTLLKEGTHVNDRYGNAVGGLASVMLDSTDTTKVTGIVAKAGWLFTKETFIPLEWIDSIGTEGISLKYAKGELSNLPQPQTNFMQSQQETVPDLARENGTVSNYNEFQNPPARDDWASSRDSATEPVVMGAALTNTAATPDVATSQGSRQLENMDESGSDRGDSNADMDNRSPLAPATNRIADQLAGNSSGPYSGADTKNEGEPSHASPNNLVGNIITPANINASGTGAGVSPLVPPVVSEQDRER